MADGFSLDSIRKGVSSRMEELNEDAEPRSVEDSRPDRRRPISYEHSDFDRTEAPKDDMRRYWRQFETTPIIRKPITSFASRVTEPGYYIEARDLDSDEIEQLGNWLKNSSIIEGQPGRDFRLLAKKSIIQREVRGTALVEKAPHRDDDNQIAGLKLLNPEVCEAVTRPHQNILIAPDDGDRFPDAPDAESEGKAAWLQDVIEAQETGWGTPIRGSNGDADDDMKVGFRRDEIIPLTRDADVGEVFGTSRIEAVSDRIEGIKQKLDDNDQAIESKAYPLWLFKFGDPETTGVWPEEKIDNFMKHHEMDKFHPGMKQGVRGDVSIETISGEVADIAEYLNFDLQWIMASMPMPMFALGAFGDMGSVGQVAGVAQQQNISRQIKEARREIEDEFTPVLQEVAQQQGIDETRAEGIRLRLGDPQDPDPETKRSQQVIRYVSDANGGGGVQQPQEAPRAEQPQTPQQEQPGASEDNPLEGMFSESELESTAARVWDETYSVEELSPVEREKEALASKVMKVLTEVRDETLDHVGQSYSSTPQFAAVEFENIANTKLNRAIRGAAIRSDAKGTFKNVVEDVEQTYGNSDTRFSQNQNVSFYAQTFENSVRDASEEMLRRARVLIRDGVVSGERWADVRSRVTDTYDDSELRNRANMIAHMELKRARETTKLQQFEADPEVVGVRVSNPDASARVTRQLHGEEAYFEQGEIDNQLANKVREDELRKGFNPLPRTPPYHFNDTTTLEPIYRDE